MRYASRHDNLDWLNIPASASRPFARATTAERERASLFKPRHGST